MRLRILMINNTNRNRYLYANATIVSAGSTYSLNNKVNANYVWKFTENSSDNNYFIESMGAEGGFIQSSEVTNNEVPLVSVSNDSDYFTINNGLYLISTSSNRYLKLNTSNKVVGGKSNDNNTSFKLYRVTETTNIGTIPHTETIPISTINKETGEALPITAINRNDFIDILVNVNYNEKTGTFDFEVADWDKKEGEMEFN